MRKFDKSFLVTLLLSNQSFASSSEDLNLAECLNLSKHKYFANHHYKKVHNETKDPIYRDYIESISLLNSINLDNKYDFTRLEKLIKSNKLVNKNLCKKIAELYEQKESFDKALELYNQISNTTSDIVLKKIYINIIEENYDEAWDLLKDVNDEKYESEKNYYKGIIQYLKKEYEEALNTFDLLKENEKYKTKIPCLVVASYVEIKKYRTALNYVKKLEENNINFDNKIEVYRLVGDSCMFRKKYSEAIEFYKKSLLPNQNGQQMIEAEQYSLAASPTNKKKIEVINSDDLDEIADIEADDSSIEDDEDIKEEDKKLKDDDKKENSKEKNNDLSSKKGYDNKKAKQEKKEKEIIDNEDSKRDSKVLSPRVLNREDIEEDNDEDDGEDEETLFEEETKKTIINTYNEIKLRLACALYKNDQYDEAIYILQQISYDDLKLFQLANYYLGLICLKKDVTNEALKFFEKVKELNINSEIRAEAMFYCAAINYNLKNFDSAKEIINNFKSTYSDHQLSEQMSNLLFKMCINEKKYDIIINELEKVKEKSIQQEALFQKATLCKGNELFNQNHCQEAINMFEKSLDSGDNFEYHNLACLGLGECYMQDKRYKEALEEYGNVEASFSKYYQALLGIAYINFNSKKYDKAYQLFIIILNKYKSKLDKKTIENIQNRLADCLFIKKQYQNALQGYQKNTNDHSFYYQGIIYDIWNDSEKAMSCFRKINSASQYYEKAILEIGTIQLSRSQFTRAISTFSEIVDKHFDSKYFTSALLKRAIAYTNLKKFSCAQEDYLEFLDGYPGDERSANVLANLLEITKDENIRKQYIDKYKKKIDVKDMSFMLFNDAKNAFYSQSYETAIKFLNKYISEYRNGKNYDEACFLLAESYRITKDIDTGIKYYILLATKESSDFYIKSLIKLSAVYKGKEDHVNAIKYFERLRGKAKDKRDKLIALNGLMNEFYKIEDYRKAKEIANECLKNHSKEGNIIKDANIILCRCNLKLKQYNQVVNNCKKFLKNAEYKDIYDEMMFLIASTYYETGQNKSSLNMLFDLTKRYPNSKWFDECYLLMAKNYIALKRYKQANNTLDSIINNVKDENLRERAKKLKIKGNNN